MRLARTRLFGIHRDVYRAVGERLRERGHLRAVDDVLYLTVSEIEAHWQGTAVSADLAQLALARRREFAAYETLPAPNRIVTTGSPYDAEATSAIARHPEGARAQRGAMARHPEGARAQRGTMARHPEIGRASCRERV